jgi:hypothetical protein
METTIHRLSNPIKAGSFALREGLFAAAGDSREKSPRFRGIPAARVSPQLAA